MNSYFFENSSKLPYAIYKICYHNHFSRCKKAFYIGFFIFIPKISAVLTGNKGVRYYIPGGEKTLNIGLGVALIFVAIIFILWDLFSRKRKNKIISNALLLVGTIALSISILLLTGIYDPYTNHIR